MCVWICCTKTLLQLNSAIDRIEFFMSVSGKLRMIYMKNSNGSNRAVLSTVTKKKSRFQRLSKGKGTLGKCYTNTG